MATNPIQHRNRLLSQPSNTPTTTGDYADRAFLDLDAAVKLGVSKSRSELEEADDPNLAVKREKGEEAICLGCKEPIPDARLRALPGAKRCKDCQEVHETAQRLSRRSQLGKYA